MSADLKLIEGAGLSPGSEATLRGSEAALRRGLQGMALDGEAGDISSELQARGIAAIKSTMAREKGRAARGWAAGASLLVAAGAVMAFVFSGQSVSSDDAVATLTGAAGQVEMQAGGSGSWSKLATGEGFVEGTSLRTGEESRASLSMDREITVAMEASSELRWPQGKLRVLELAHGSVSFAVKDLQKGEFFIVNAGNTKVTVHGTEFSVTLLEEDAAPCVIVTEGLVEVAGPSTKVWVSAGQETGCGLPEERAEASDDQAADEKSAAGMPQVKTRRSKALPPTAKVEPSNLAEQNKLFQKALVAERAGRLDEALRHLDSFVAKYPDSPLGAQVRAQRASLNARK